MTWKPKPEPKSDISKTRQNQSDGEQNRTRKGKVRVKREELFGVLISKFVAFVFILVLTAPMGWKTANLEECCFHVVLEWSEKQLSNSEKNTWMSEKQVLKHYMNAD